MKQPTDGRGYQSGVDAIVGLQVGRLFWEMVASTNILASFLGDGRVDIIGKRAFRHRL